VDHTETNPQFVQLTAPNEVVVAVTFDISVGDVVGPMTIIYPHMLLEPIMPKLNSHRWFAAAPRAASPEEESGLRQGVLRLGVTVRGVLAEIPLTIRDLLAMKPGDILCSGRAVDVPALVELEGVPRFTARPGIVNRRKALQLLSVIPKGENPRDVTTGSGNARILSA
jgi:flagellar motor switch protein FliM